MSKQTAVEWLIDELNGYDEDCEIFQIAKAMEREQIITAFCEGYDHDGDNYDKAEIKYYIQTYKGGEQ